MKQTNTALSTIVRSAMLASLLAPLFAMQSAQANDYSALIKAKKYAEAERAISAKLAVEMTNPDALAAKTDLILSEGKVSRLDEAVSIAEKCIASNPKSSVCHEALGNSLGVKADKGGMMSGVASLGKIRDAFKKAIELDPKNFTAAYSLMTFYMDVPGLLGGSNSKAKELIEQTKLVSPAAASLFQAKFDAKDGNIAKARANALAVNVSGAPMIAQLQHDLLIQIGIALIGEKKFVESENLFKEVAQRFPESSDAYLGQGRSLQELGKHKEAIIQLEKSIAIHASSAAFYRIGKASQALNDKVKAIAAYEKALSLTPELGKKSRADAEDQLKALK